MGRRCPTQRCNDVGPRLPQTSYIISNTKPAPSGAGRKPFTHSLPKDHAAPLQPSVPSLSPSPSVVYLPAPRLFSFSVFLPLPSQPLLLYVWLPVQTSIFFYALSFSRRPSLYSLPCARHPPHLPVQVQFCRICYAYGLRTPRLLTTVG